MVLKVSDVMAAVFCAGDEPSTPEFCNMGTVTDFPMTFFFLTERVSMGMNFVVLALWSHRACQNVDPKNYQAYVARRPSNL